MPGRCRCWKLTCPEMEKWLLGQCPPTHSCIRPNSLVDFKTTHNQTYFLPPFSLTFLPSPILSPSCWFHPVCRNLCPTLWKMFTMITLSSATDHASRYLLLSFNCISSEFQLHWSDSILFDGRSDFVICGFVGFWIDSVTEVWIFYLNWMLNPVRFRVLDFYAHNWDLFSEWAT